MKLDITGRHIAVSDGLREHTEDRLEKINKLFDDETEAHVVLFVEKHRHVAEIQIKTRAGVFSGQESTGEYPPHARGWFAGPLEPLDASPQIFEVIGLQNVFLKCFG